MANTSLASTEQIFKKLFETNGLDAARLFAEAGFSAGAHDDPNARVPIKVSDALMVRAANLIPDEGWGLKAAGCWHPGNLGVLGHAWLASSTLRTALTRLTRYWHILGERAKTRIDDSANGLRFTYAIQAEEPVVETVLPDCVFSIVLDMCRTNAGAALKPLQVTLRRRQPANPERWDSFFGCNVEFGAPENSLTLSTADVDRVLPTSNRPLAGVLDGLLTEQLAKLSRADVVSRCKVEFLEQLTSGEPSAEDIAQRLHMSERTLQRKLAEADTTYQKLVDETRRDMALRYIDDRTKSITDITFLLGFSGQSAFTRAFKRWMGLSPTDYRRRAAA